MLKLNLKTIDNVLDISYKKENLSLENYSNFKFLLNEYIENINAAKFDEVHCKTHLQNFLRDAFYKKDYEINTQPYIGNFGSDLVIREKVSIEKNALVLFELKIENSSDMIDPESINRKAFQEALLYYLWEKNKLNNHEIKHIVISNYKEFYYFNAEDFASLFQKEKSYNEFFKKWNNKQLDEDTTKFFYQEIGKLLANSEKEITAVYFNLWSYKKEINNENKESQSKVSRLYKFLSPRHSLKLTNLNDSNSLNKDFYYELLHIIGLKEKSLGGKTVIDRKDNPDNGSLIENTIARLKSKDAILKLDNPEHFGNSDELIYFNVALELCITWLNRILFLKLLEGQLISYHRIDNKHFRFLNKKGIDDFDKLNLLFFDVLAKDDREPDIKKKFEHIPYLNSSLFERTSLEETTIEISELRNELELPIIQTTILKNETGKISLYKKDGSAQLKTLDYLLQFLNSYDFGSEEQDSINSDTKQIISAPVLGLIFEKINGHKDGSFFTPGFITMYMCRETIRRSVLQKFKENSSETNFDSFEELSNYSNRKNKIEDLIKLNNIINSLRICDPAVGSGHFLVSALNEIIAIKSDLGILIDELGIPLSIHIKIINDELEISDNKTGEIFQYAINVDNKPSQLVSRIQETLFREKQLIIENCLFGVDINPNSVKICRLRLWVELLKNAYYTKESNYQKLQTLPNIDINIKKGNSLISRFKTNFKIDDFRNMKLRSTFLKEFNHYSIDVLAYKNCKNKKQKEDIRQRNNSFKTLISNLFLADQKDYVAIKELQEKLGETKFNFFTDQKDDFNNETNKLNKQIQDDENAFLKKYEEIYGNAFEWRFEFPEILDKEGNFNGFDVIIGNPPYIGAVEMSRSPELKKYFKTHFPEAKGAYDVYVLFLNKALAILKKEGSYSWIIPNKFLIANYASQTKNLLLTNGLISSIDISIFNIFENASVYPIIIEGDNYSQSNYSFKEFSLTKETDLQTKKFITREKQKDYKTFKDFNIKIMSGTTGFEANKIKNYISDELSQNAIPFIVSGCIDRYSYLNKDVRYMGKKYNQAFIKNNGEIAESKWNFWASEKIIIAGMTKVIEATYVNKSLALGVGAYGIYNYGGFSPYFLVGLLNSKFMSNYINIKFKDKHLAGGYLAINKGTIEEFPLTDVKQKDQQEIIKLVTEIMTKKDANKNCDTSALEDKIDIIIYNIYNLSFLESQLIDPKLNYESYNQYKEDS